MTTDALKKQAREHEQNEEWEKALGLYRRSVDEMEPGGEPEIAVYNRVADLELRLGNVEAAIREYEQAIDLYLEADLPNNAIAICRKILRNVPGRAETFLRMGEIRARQGFGVDARQNVLTYAEMMEARGDSDAATAALKELVSLFPADAEARVFLGERLVTLGDTEGGVNHLLAAWQRLAHQGSDEAGAVEARIRELEPSAEFPSSDDLPGDPAAEDAPVEHWREGDFPSHGLSVDFGGGDGPVERFLDVGPEAADAFGSTFGSEAGDEEPGEMPGAGTDAYSFGEIRIGNSDSGDDHVLASGREFPAGIEPPADAGTHAVADPDAVAEVDPDGLDVESLQDISGLHSFGEIEIEIESEIEAEASAPGVLPSLAGGEFADDFAGDFDDDPEDDAFNGDEGEAPPLPLLGEDLAGPTPPHSGEGLVAELEADLAAEPDHLSVHRELVERAHEEGDRGLLLRALSGLAAALERVGQEEESRTIHEQVLQLDARNAASLLALGRSAPGGGPKPSLEPPTPAPDTAGGFVDLGALVLDDNEAPTTRWVVDDQRSGDEDADFAHMLSKFKAKVAQHITRDDARSSYDLGTAYLEMGLVDESIGMFQQALRAQPGHLASLEMLGQCFLDRDEPQVAIRVLERALHTGVQVEDDLLGIYYFLAVSHERAGNRDEAREFYEKVFSLDINFKDVTDRLRALR
jgi:tetratricopeptide (TPR) repeat protein